MLRKRAIEARDRSAALFTVAHAVIARFRAEKDRRGLLDYDDLIDKTLDLLKDERAAWVHYKLDRGIHHVLIDEAQDTSPKQWEIVKALVERILRRPGRARAASARSSRSATRSSRSSRSRAPRRANSPPCACISSWRTSAPNFEFVATEFKHSFRSGPNVLGAVDTVFARAEAFAGLTADPVAPIHEALPDEAPGLVEIWEPEKPDEREKMPGWAAPFDTQTVDQRQVKLAQPHRRHVAAWRRQGRRPKDVLILVRRRGALFEAIIRALKNANIPVAGADRLVLTEHIAVMDLMVLADALLLPQDDLALATVLKSPLFGLDDDALFKLAWNRKGSLRTRCAHSGPNLRRDSTSCARRRANMSPFAFYAWLLGAEQGRRKIPGAARPRGRRRARRVPQSRARLRAQRNAVAAGLRRLAARGESRDQARHGDGARRGAGDDRARRQGPGSADRHPCRHHDAAAGLASAAAVALAAGEAPCRARAAAWSGQGRKTTTSARWRRRAQAALRGRATNTGGCSMWR